MTNRYSGVASLSMVYTNNTVATAARTANPLIPVLPEAALFWPPPLPFPVEPPVPVLLLPSFTPPLWPLPPFDPVSICFRYLEPGHGSVELSGVWGVILTQSTSNWYSRFSSGSYDVFLPAQSAVPI